MSKKKWIYENKWMYFYFTNSFELTYQVCGYFDNRPRINIALFFFILSVKLPFKNKWTDECDPPSYGISYHHKAIWIYMGGKGNIGGNKTKVIRMPYDLEWYRSSYYLSDYSWYHQIGYKDNRLSYEELEKLKYKEEFTYTYVTSDGQTQNRIATINVEEREWRWRWFKSNRFNWLKFTRRIERCINVEFDDGIGERGQVTGCGYTMLPNELPCDTLRRMEKERIFN